MFRPYHQARTNIIQVIKLLAKIWIRILATDGCVARDCMFIYYLYVYNLVYSSLLWYA
jgi:hypothetical protein